MQLLRELETNRYRGYFLAVTLSEGCDFIEYFRIIFLIFYEKIMYNWIYNF